MKIIYTDEALRDLDGILTFIRSRYPRYCQHLNNDFEALSAASAGGQ